MPYTLEVCVDSTASALAAKLGVSRQIVVGDVALLRAGGAEIEATPRGYQFHPTPGGYTGILACVHRTAEEMRTELYMVVDQGGVVVDVAVENPLYGELRGNLNLASRYDVDTFITQAANTPECLLSRMTGGVHLHTLRGPDEETFQRIKAALREKGILYLYCKKTRTNCLSPKNEKRWISNETMKVVDYFGHPH